MCSNAAVPVRAMNEIYLTYNKETIGDVLEIELHYYGAGRLGLQNFVQLIAYPSQSIIYAPERMRDLKYILASRLRCICLNDRFCCFKIFIRYENLK